MAETAFNTIAEIQRLRDAGLPQEQAEAITLSIHAGVTGGVATKADLEKVETGLKADLEKVETGLRADIDLLRSEMESGDKELGAAIDLLRSDMNGKIDGVEQRLETKIERAKFDLTWRLLGGFAVLNAIMIAILRFMGGV
ncbi:coiled-coil domain-containing protein [Hoeflea sp.]|uniref:coiled-coil domain-containing protein n=1 Tax=Hoeflea sp. TaxID=1940281 RepID=UPI003B011959